MQKESEGKDKMNKYNRGKWIVLLKISGSRGFVVDERGYTVAEIPDSEDQESHARLIAGCPDAHDLIVDLYDYFSAFKIPQPPAVILQPREAEFAIRCKEWLRKVNNQ